MSALEIGRYGMALSFASARLIMALFFVYAGAMANWVIRIPDVQHRLGLEPAGLALCLLGMPTGLVLSMSFSGPLVEAIGPKRAVRLGFLFYLTALLLPGFAIAPWMLFLSLMLAGLCMGPLEVGLNVIADRIGQALGHTVMSRCHGFWSLGLMAGSVVGSAAATIGLPPGIHMAIALPVLCLMGQLLALRLPDQVPAEVESGEKAPVFVLPPKSLVLLCFFGFGMLLVEGGVSDWSAIYLRDVFGAHPPVTGFAFTAFGLLMAAGRLAGDWLSTRYGPARMARICCIVGVAGLAAMVLAINSEMVIAGAAATGFGVSIIFPLAVTAAASREGSAAVNVSALSLLSFTGFLIGPPMVGFAAEAAGLRIGIATLLLAALMSLALSGEVRVRKAAVHARLPEERVEAA